jgi:hypothetical protein
MLTLAPARPARPARPVALARLAGPARPVALTRGAALAVSLMLSLLAPACQEAEPEATTQGASSTGEPVETEPHVTFVGTVDTVDLCGVVGATHISFRARPGRLRAGPADALHPPDRPLQGMAR